MQQYFTHRSQSTRATNQLQKQLSAHLNHLNHRLVLDRPEHYYEALAAAVRKMSEHFPKCKPASTSFQTSEEDHGIFVHAGDWHANLFLFKVKNP